jgi:glycosyltransferase involved in cell wall biosynthesis
MTRVLHVITELRRGGAELSLLGLLEECGGEACEHRVIAIGEDGPVGDQIRRLGVSVESLNVTNPAGGGLALMRLRRVIRRWRPSVVQGWMYHGNLAARMASLCMPDAPPVVWSVRHTLSDIRREKWMTRRVIRAGAKLSGGVSAVVWNSDVGRAQHESIGYRAHRHLVIHNGIDSDRVQFGDDARQRARASWGVSEQDRVVGSVARFHPMKGHRALAEAVGSLSEQAGDIYLALVGRGCEPGGPAEAAIRDVSGVIDKVLLVGELEDPSMSYPGFDVFVTPSGWGESFPNALVEAMASGVPCVATQLGAVPEIVADDGFTVPAGDRGALAPAIRKALSLSAAQRRGLTTRGRNRVMRSYCRKRCAAEYMGVWRDLAEADS